VSSLAAALAEQKTTIKGPRCTVGVIFDNLDTTDTLALTEALESTMTGQGIANALKSEGHKVPAATIQRHRRKECNCDAR